MNLFSIKKLTLLPLFSLFLIACGGGGGSGSGGGTTTPPPPVNVAPTVNAGADQSVDEFTTVTVTATASDSDGSIESYEWSVVNGGALSLTGSDTNEVSFEAPTTGSLTSNVYTLRVTVTDDDGATSSDDVLITVNSTNQDPVANAGSDQTVDEQSTVTLDASASTDDGTITSFTWSQLSGSAVTINGTGATVTFDAPAISSQEVLEFQVLVLDDRGASALDTVVITVNPVAGLNNPPTVDAGSDITTSSGQTVNLSAVSFNDSDGAVEEFLWEQVSGTAVTINSPDASDATFTAPNVTADEVLVFRITVTDNEGATGSDTVSVTVTPQATTVKISGTATYDNVPHNNNNGLDYDSTSRDPIRLARVELEQNGNVVQTATTDLNGAYSFDVDPNTTAYRVRIYTHTISTASAAWDMKVVDNTTLDTATNQQAFYTLLGSQFDVGTSDVSRPNMHAASGWGGTSYTGNRIAGAFHILDRVVDGIIKIVAVDNTVQFPSVDINWSVNNNLSSGSGNLADLRNGNLGTSFYTTFGSGAGEFQGPQLFILGAENSDTDEYDGHVVVHEWGHYFENNLSRSDSIGGSHTQSDRLDMRLAFGEGFGNAWAGIITDDSFYRDSGGSQQAQGFSINVEANFVSNRGWYNEGSVQALLYDIYDSVNDGTDGLSLGLQPIYDVLVGPQRTTDAFTSIFSFSEYFLANNPGASTTYNFMLGEQEINANDRWGTGETNDAGAVPSTNVLPVYIELTVDGPQQEVCSIDDFDTTGQTAESGNKLSNFRFVRFTIPSDGSYTFNVSASATQDPDMPIYLNGSQIHFAAPGGDGDPGDASDSTFTLSAGSYVAEAYEFDNTFRGNTANSTDECFNVSIVSN